MPNKNIENLVIENAKIVFRNFSGKEGKFNKEGTKSFCVVIEDPTWAQKLLDDGWNVRIRAPRDEDDTPMHYLQVAVSFDHIPPRITLVTKRNQTLLDDESVGALDFAEIRNVDLVIHPYSWTMPSGLSGVKAYVKEMYVTIEESQFSDKYQSM